MSTPAPNTRLSEAERKILEAVDKRVNDAVEKLAERQGVMENQLAEVMRAIKAINPPVRQPLVKGEDGGAAEETGGAQPEQTEDWSKPTRYEFPKFDGVGFEGWLMRVEFFFEIAKVLGRDRVKVAAIHLESKALQWHRGFSNLQGEAALVDWEGYVTAMGARFGTQAYADPLADLRNLRQTGSLQDYMDAFDETYPRTGIREDQALSMFLSGLMDELQIPVRMFKPTRLAEAFSLAKLQDITLRALGGKAKGGSGGGNTSGTGYSYAKSLTVTTAPPKSGGYSGNTAGKDTKLAGPSPRLTPG